MPRKHPPRRPVIRAGAAYVKRLARSRTLQRAEKRIKAKTDSPEFRAEFEQIKEGVQNAVEFADAIEWGENLGDQTKAAIDLLAGELGLEPGPYTLAELCRMAAGRRRSRTREVEYFAEVLAKKLRRALSRNNTIISLGERTYQIGRTPPVVLPDQMDSVLQAFLEAPGNALDHPELIKKAGFERAPKTLADIAKRHPRFALAIRFPKVKGAGYHVQIMARHVAPV